LVKLPVCTTVVNARSWRVSIRRVLGVKRRDDFFSFVPVVLLRVVRES
jgi:hypothetical protein